MIDVSEGEIPANQASNLHISPEHTESTDIPSSSQPNTANLNQPPTLHLNLELQERCIAIFTGLQELTKMKDLVLLPNDYHHQCESLRMKIDSAIDKIEVMVMDSHLQATKDWGDEIVAIMTNLKLRTDVNKQFRDAEYYPPEPEPQPTIFEIRAPWVEELLNQSRKSDDSELRAELEAQKKKQQDLEDKIKEMTADQKLMKEQQAELLQNQAKADSKMNTMLEILMKIQKP